jgi:hypothetical protein
MQQQHPYRLTPQQVQMQMQMQMQQPGPVSATSQGSGGTSVTDDQTVYSPPFYPPSECGSSFTDFGVEIGRMGCTWTHTPMLMLTPMPMPMPPSGGVFVGMGACAKSPGQGHAKTGSSGGIGGIRKILGFGKKDKDKDKD